MKRYKKSGMLLAAAIMLCTLNACADEAGIQIVDGSDTQPEYLSFFSLKSLSGSDLTKYWTDNFTKKYDRRVYVDFDGASYYSDEGLTYRELLEKRLESSAPDDLYIINAEDVLEFGKKGYWMDLSGMDFVDNLSESALYQSTYDGKVFSIPLSYTGFGFVWNVDLLAEHGLTIPQNSKEFFVVCDKLKSEGILPYGANKGFSLTVPAMCVGFAGLYQSEERTDKIAALNSGASPVSDYMREGFEFLSFMIESGYMEPEQALAATPRIDDVELFLGGRCAFICSGLGSISEWEEQPFQMEVTGLPVLPEGCIAVYGANSRLCINPNSKHLETACDFIEMVGAPEALMKSAELENTMSVAKADDTGRFPMEQKLVLLLQQPDQIPNQDFALHFNTWESIRDAARELCGGAGVEEVCAILDKKQREELKEYGGK